MADKTLEEVDDWQDDPGDWEDEPQQAAPAHPMSVGAPYHGPELRAPERTAWNTLRDVAEASGTVPVGIIPDEWKARGAVASLTHGPALNWADETAGLLAERDAALANLQKPRGEQVDPGWAYRHGRDAFRNVEGAFRQESPAAAFALQTASGMLSPTPRGSESGSFLSRYMSAMVPGAVSGAGAAEESRDMAEAAAVGAPLGAAGQAVGEAFGDVIGGAIGAVGRGAQSRVSAAAEKETEMGLAKAAQETASAKGKLGAATQEANRFVENLMRLEQIGGMTQEQLAQLADLKQRGVLSALHEKLADSMLEQVPGAAGRIDIARAAYEGLAGDEAARAAQYAEDIGSGAEAKRQVMERVKRYLPTVVGAAAGADGKGLIGGALAGYALGGTPGSALVGGLSGSALRPAIRAVGRMAQHPAVQRGLFSPVANAAGPTSAIVSELFENAGPAMTYAWRNAVEGPQPKQDTTSDIVQQALETPDALGPYAQQLQQAAADGNLPIVHYSLQQRDPKYRALVEHLRAGGTQ